MRRTSFVFSTCLLVLFGCTEEGDTFDREAMMNAIGQNVVLPTYRDFKARTEALETEATAFCASPDVAGLGRTREAWIAAHRTLDLAESFAFGPHTDNPPRLGPKINTWPVRESSVDELLAGSEPLDTASFVTRGSTVQGLPAIAYVLFDASMGDEEFVAALTPRRCEFVVGASGAAADVAAQYVSAWESEHLEEWASGTGRYPSVFGAASVLVEQMIFTAENVRELKIGKPFGKRDAGELQLDQFESPYSRTSLQDARAATESIENVWRGRYVDRDGVTHEGLGVRDWLVARRPALEANVDAAFADAQAKLDAITPDLEAAVSDDAVVVEAAYQAVKELQLVLAVEMAAALNITVTFNPTDGD